MRRYLEQFDTWFIHLLRKVSMPAARVALFVVFFWFGILKIFGLSPASPMVMDLMEVTLPFMQWETFIILFALYEMLIGVSFLIPRFARFAIALLIPHMVMTCLPLLFLPDMTWQGFFIPTLEGQYIVKNLVIVALAVSVAAHLHPMHKVKR
ncbi:MAG: hypothetical protein QG640_322 [Patescibacteria group bacterium]|nr:hypothetical protein [Patescibacteria group bacterium]